MEQSDFPINRTYSMTYLHIALLEALKTSLRKDRSEIVREALEDYARKHGVPIHVEMAQSDQHPESQ